MKVLLISPFFESPWYPLYLPSENLGIAYIASYLRQHNIEIEILDANMLEISSRKIVSQISSQHYDLMGISSSSQLLIDETRAIASEVKKVWPKIHITVGGHFPTLRHKEILEQEKNIDSVVRGDGEETALELVNALTLGKNLVRIAGLSFRNTLGQVIINNPRPVYQNLDNFPWPVRDTLPYIQNLKHSWPTQISSSRGCYASCSFCDIRAFYGRNWRARSAINLVDEIEWLHKEFNSKVFRFTDDEFFGPLKYGAQRAREIALEIIRRKLKVELMVIARAHMVKKELFALLKEAGTIDCLIGVESGVDRILRLYSKGVKVATNMKAINILKELGISLNLGFIMFDPRMTFDELRQNYRFLQENEIVTVDSLRSRLWSLFGTPVVEQLRESGLVTQETLGNVKYRFADESVAKVFQIISQCAEITYPLERAIFVAKKFSKFSIPTLSMVLKKTLSLWVDIFEAALKNPDLDNLNWVTARRNAILEDMCESTPTKGEESWTNLKKYS